MAVMVTAARQEESPGHSTGASFFWPSPLAGEGGRASRPGEGLATRMERRYPSPALRSLPSPARGEGQDKRLEVTAAAEVTTSATEIATTAVVASTAIAA